MRLVRILAVVKDKGVSDEGTKLLLLCCLHEDQKLCDGEWFGYIKTGSIVDPFVLQRRERLFFGREDQYFEPTNIGKRLMKVGEYFSVTRPDDPQRPEDVFQITHVYEVETTQPAKPAAQRGAPADALASPSGLQGSPRKARRG